MQNADSLKGKEFIDFILTYLQGQGEQPDEPAEEKKQVRRLPKFCKNELKKDKAKKL